MKNHIDDGINVFFGLQGFGKGYICTHKAVHEMIKPKSGRKVISNYEIKVRVPLTLKQKIINRILDIYKDNSHTFKLFNKEWVLSRQIEKVFESYKWEDHYTGMPVRDALVIIDETHDIYTGTYAYEFSKDDRRFFSKLRHNNVAVFLMTQSFEDIHPFIRRRLAYLHEVHKLHFKWSKRPHCFYIDTYTSIKNYMRKDDHKLHKKAKKTLYRHEKIPFTDLVGSSYNTHFYKAQGEEPQYELWSEYKKRMKEQDERRYNHSTLQVNTNVKEGAISTLMRLFKYKRKDATQEVNTIFSNSDSTEVDTIEKILRAALKRRNKVLEEIEDNTDE